MPSLLDLLKKGGNAVKDAFVYSEEEKASGKKPSILERIPMRASDTRDNIGSFFAPSAKVRDDGSGIADPELRVRDVVREVPSNAGTLLKDILQGTARSFDFVGRKLSPMEEDISEKTGFNKRVDDILFGGADKRANSLTDVGETELGLDREKNPILTPLAGLGIIGLDFVPGGQGKSKGFKQFIKSLTDETAETIAKSTDRNLIEQTVRESAPAMKDAEVATLVDDLVLTKSVDDVKDVVTGKGAKALEDARQYKNADDYIKSQGDVLYHTTPAKFDKFDNKFLGANTGEIADNVDRGFFFSDNIKDIEDFKATLAKGTEDFRGNKLTQKDVADFRTIEKVADKSKFFQMNEQSIMNGDIPVKDAEILSKIFGTEDGAVLKGQDAVDHVIEVIDGEMGDMREFWDISGDDFIKEIKRKGYIGFKTNFGGGVDEYVVMEPNKLPDKSHLESVWQKAINDSKKEIIDAVPKANEAKVAKALDGAEAETKKLSPRRLQDAKKYGMSEDVMGRMLHAKAGGRLTHEEASNLSETINAPMRDLLEKDARSFQLSRPKIEAYSQELQGYFENVVKKLKANAEAFPKDKDLAQQYQEASRTYMKARTTLEAVISEAGRVVEGSKVIGKYSRLPGMDGKIKKVRDQIVKFAENNPKHADLPTEFDMALETVDLNNTTQMLDFLTQWNRASFLQKLSEFQKASLLSALSTHAVNALGNAIQQVLDIPVRAVAGVLDAGKSAVTGSKRTVYAGESLAQVRGAFRSAPAAIERAVKALGNEHYAQELRRTEIEAGTVVPAIRGRFGKVVRLPFRLLQMADLGFRTVKKGAESEALATRIARTEGLKGKAFKERVTELKDNLPQDMLDLVDERVERSLMLEELDGMLKSVEDLKNKYPALQFVIPFYRTLVNLSREAYRMTPIGGIGRTVGRITPGQTGRNIERAFKNKWTQNEATKMEELSRQIIGTSIMAWVVTNMLNGDVEITGPAPSNAGDREVFYGQGKLPHSIRYGDTWVEFQRVQPIGQLLQVGASISEAIEAYKNTGQLTSKDVEKEMLNSISDIGSMVFTQSPFTGVSDLFDLLKGGAYQEGYVQAGNRWIGQLAGTFIPNILRRLTVAQDPIVYEKRDIESQLKSRVPGLQKDLTPRRDVFGEIVRQGGTFTSRFASPIRTTESIENRLYDEMADLKFTPTVPTRKAFNADLSVKEYDLLKQFYGPRFRDEMWSVVNDGAYKTLTPEQKRDVLSGISRKVMDMARQTLFPVYMEKDQLRKQWQAEGYTPAVIEDALNAQFPYDKETLEIYAETLLDQSIQQGDARKTIEDLLQ